MAALANHLLDEAERSLHDALCVLSQTVKKTRGLPGGGAPAMLMAQAQARKLSQVKPPAFEGFEIFIKYLPPSTTEPQLSAFFGEAGTIVGSGEVTATTPAGGEAVHQVDHVRRCAVWGQGGRVGGCRASRALRRSVSASASSGFERVVRRESMPSSHERKPERPCGSITTHSPRWL